MMTVLEAAKKVLEEAGAPLHVRDLTATMLAKGYWSTQGLTPEATVQARLAMDIKTRAGTSAFTRSAPGCYGLRGQAAETPTPEAGPLVQQPLFAPETDDVDPAATVQTLSFTDAAEQVLQEQSNPTPMHYKEITRIAMEKGLLSTRGLTPEATMYAQILTEIGRYLKRGVAPRFQKLGQGMVGLTAWGGDSIAPPASMWSAQDEAYLLRIKGVTPVQFEKLVAKLLTLMFDADIQETRLSGDSGLDARGRVILRGGIGVELVAQAKRYTQGNVQRPEIQNLRGSMGPQSLGIFITTMAFSAGAVAEAQRPTALQPIGLINGKELVGLMKEFDLTLDAQGEAVLVEEVDSRPVENGSHA
jgi:restriction system protein